MPSPLEVIDLPVCASTLTFGCDGESQTRRGTGCGGSAAFAHNNSHTMLPAKKPPHVKSALGGESGR
jgi:hypothetical protein